MKEFIRRYRNNRLWGDSIVEALWWSLRGKAFPNAELIQELNQEINNNNKGVK